MAYQNVGTPRFYINTLEWFDSLGGDITHHGTSTSIHRTLPVNPSLVTSPPNPTFSVDFPDMLLLENSFVAILGHNLGTIGGATNIDLGGAGEGNIYTLRNNPDIIVNDCDGNTSDTTITDGFSILPFNGTEIGTFHVEEINSIDFNVGSFVVGSFYTMPNAPDLSLTMSREYGSTKEITTYNGSSMSNTMWSKPPMWGNLGAWELGNTSHCLIDGSRASSYSFDTAGGEEGCLNQGGSWDESTQFCTIQLTDSVSCGMADGDWVEVLGSNQALARSGRRTWQLKFSYMDDGDLWGSNQMLTQVDISHWAGDDTLYDELDIAQGGRQEYNLLTDQNFFSQVWHKTLGGTLPFIFQPDSTNNNPDGFAICRFKSNSLKATQSAFNVYDISLSIEEAW